MRVHDQAPPAIPPHAIPPAMPSARWGAKPVIGLEYLPAGDLWDDVDADVTWDNPNKVWDDPAAAAGFTDVWCDTAGVEIIHGEPDEHDLLAPSRCTLTLVDRTGRYRRRTPDGRLTFYAPGRRVCAGAVIDGVWWWLFAGTVATWHELGDGMVEIVAYATTAKLAQPPGRNFSPGVDGQKLEARAAAIVAAAAIPVTVRADAGTNTLALPDAEDQAAPLELLQQAAWSDGGVVVSDADDTLIVRNRVWRNGRDDQPPRWTLTDNRCTAPDAVIVWEAQTAHDDDWLAGRVILSNLAGLAASYTQPAGTGEPIDPTLVYTHPDVDLWKLQAEGDTLAAWIGGLRRVSRLAIALARVYLHDARFDYWQQTIDLRIGDRLNWQHDDVWPDGTAVLVDVDVITHTIRHLLTPETWIVELETTPAIAYTTTPAWDVTALRWDSADLNATWR